MTRVRVSDGPGTVRHLASLESGAHLPCDQCPGAGAASGPTGKRPPGRSKAPSAVPGYRDTAMRAAVLTISTTLAGGEGEDASGPRLAELLAEAGFSASVQVLADDRPAIESRLRELVADDVRFVFTTGGTGLTPDDVTPEATRAVIERDAPAFQQAMLAEGMRHQPLALLTRGVSGIAGSTLIINFPGSPNAIDQLFPVIAPALRHAAQSLVREGGRDEH